jgi:hypothetical protein
MTIDSNRESAPSYRFLYNFLVVLTEDQLLKLRNIAIGIKSLSTFSDEEIRELKMRLDEKQYNNRCVTT